MGGNNRKDSARRRSTRGKRLSEAEGGSGARKDSKRRSTGTLASFGVTSRTRSSRRGMPLFVKLLIAVVLVFTCLLFLVHRPGASPDEVSSKNPQPTGSESAAESGSEIDALLDATADAKAKAEAAADARAVAQLGGHRVAARKDGGILRCRPGWKQLCRFHSEDCPR